MAILIINSVYWVSHSKRGKLKMHINVQLFSLVPPLNHWQKISYRIFPIYHEYFILLKASKIEIFIFQQKGAS